MRLSKKPVEKLLDDLDDAAGKVMQGDRAAFRCLVESMGRPLVRFSARFLGNVEEAEDVVQESFVKAYQALSARAFDRRATVRSWLYRIVANASIDARRRRARRNRDMPTPQTPCEASSADTRLALSELAVWLDKLPDEQRVALILYAVEGMSAREVGEVLGCSERAVEQRLVRARVTLRQKRELP